MKEIVGDLAAEISITELRDQDLLSERLERHHAVRVRRRGEIIGVLLDSNLWTGLLERVDRLQAVNEQYEDAAVLGLIEARAGAEFSPASDEAIDEVFATYDKLVGTQRESERGH
jgi:hypothetical protein